MGQTGPCARLLPNEKAITRLIGAVLLEQNDEWAVQRARYMTLETKMIGMPILTTPRDIIATIAPIACKEPRKPGAEGGGTAVVATSISKRRTTAGVDRVPE